MRHLNDYESMLAQSTCNVAVSVSFPVSAIDSSTIKRAWKLCVNDYDFLRVCLVPLESEVGPLGQRYGLVEARFEEQCDLFRVERSVPTGKDLIRELQRIGTTKLNNSSGTYFVVCYLREEVRSGKSDASFIISLCHALSDGPGAMNVAHSFLKHLKNLLCGIESTQKTASQPLIDLQARILGDCYASNLPDEAPSHMEMKRMRDALACDPPQTNGVPVLPPERRQRLPSDSGFGAVDSTIETVYECLSAAESTALRERCRSDGATVQGALTVAWIVARFGLLNLSLPRLAIAQVPANCRALAPVDCATCLCGSGATWHTALLDSDCCAFTAASTATKAVRNAFENGQVHTWLHTLMKDPANLAPYSLMQSSVGVTPIEEHYGDMDVTDVFFFGAALSTPRSAQGTMVHAISFRGQLGLMCNYTSPGVSRAFARKSARALKIVLGKMAEHSTSETLTISALLRSVHECLADAD